ncbi:P-loop containing nucleoside triphosphate hydrolase protein [Tribonema minus]|uniref:P-loop containing nucleoside triphosphate hydrolase protein n=1 Tax=Tribonema minus TaxID=303371 RepID=A0A835YWV8_9STRA|nr:P-loop containing nucleoside triphosphate hydrolase protein [Tribonema minus]
MCALNYLHEPAILANLRQRFFAKMPYTYTGEICIAVNPYQWLDIYNERIGAKYGAALKKSDLPPHPYATSTAAFRGLRMYSKNQSILVSGESGAGKTETVKILLNHLAAIAGGEQGDTTIDKVINSNPLLESFGNAKTVRNDNSSRFGKFTELQFNERCHLVGSNINTYLLEKSRVVTHSRGERSYHVFYQLLAAPESLKAGFRLGHKSKADLRYSGLGQDATSVIEGISDADRFTRTNAALELIELDKEARAQLWGGIAAVLHLGQVTFDHVVVDGHDGSSVREQAGALSAAAALLGVGVKDLAKKLTRRVITARMESIEVLLSVDRAAEACDGLAKEVYFRLFDWLVARINQSTNHPASAARKVGLLDIFGFESFAVNSFEQFCINYANEKLQQKFTEDVFKTVQVEYASEGIAWSHIDYKDNASTLDLLEAFRTGMFALLDEEGVLPKGSEEAFVTKATKAHVQHASFLRTNKGSGGVEFTIRHYAGDINYTALGWLDKNKDTIQDDTVAMLRDSTCTIVSTAFTPLAEQESVAGSASPAGKGGHKRKGSLMQESQASKFKRQLHGLMGAINTTEVQYVRCIKPNKVKNCKHVTCRLNECGHMILHRARTSDVIVRCDINSMTHKLQHMLPTSTYSQPIVPSAAQLVCRVSNVAM